MLHKIWSSVRHTKLVHVAMKCQNELMDEELIGVDYVAVFTVCRCACTYTVRRYIIFICI